MDNGTQQTETAAKPAKRQYAKPTERLEAAALLIGAGMPVAQAAKQLGYSETGTQKLKERIKEKGLDRFLTEKRVKTATKVVDTFMKGQPVGREYKRDKAGRIEKDEVGNPVVLEPGIYPKDSTIKDCAMSVLDREYPKKVEGGGGDTITFTKIDLSVYQMVPVTHNSPILDATASGNVVDK